LSLATQVYTEGNDGKKCRGLFGGGLGFYTGVKRSDVAGPFVALAPQQLHCALQSRENTEMADVKIR